MITTHATTYPPREQHVRAAEAANKAELPGMRLHLEGMSAELAELLEHSGWEGAKELPHRAFKRGSLMFYPLGTLRPRRSQTKRGNAKPDLWFGSDKHYWEGDSDSTLRRIKLKKKPYSQLQRIIEIVEPMIDAEYEQLASEQAV